MLDSLYNEIGDGLFMNVNIRLERPEDYRTVEEITRIAFSNRAAIGNAGFDMEHYMVHKLRERDGIMELSFIAEMDERVVGHIIYSHAHVLQPDNSKVDVLSFGPISVLPEFQLMGIGSALMKHSIQEAKKLGYGAILFFGHPEYYPRFGFVEAREFSITTYAGDNFPAFMAMELKEGYLKNVSGKFVESDIYNMKLHLEEATEFDRQFFVV